MLPAVNPSPCTNCAVRAAGVCSHIPLPDSRGRSRAAIPIRKRRLAKTFGGAPARKVVIKRRGSNNGASVLCSGWALRVRKHARGRRHILSVLIPGDFFSTFALFDASPFETIEAVTDIHYCELERDDFVAELSSNPVLLQKLGEAFVAEIHELRTVSAELSTADAQARVLGFLGRLVCRLEKRSIAVGDASFPFPLTNADIADATGLATDDVDRTIDMLHAENIIRIRRKVLEVVDRAAIAKPTQD